MSIEKVFNQMNRFNVVALFSFLSIVACSEEETTLTESFFKIYDDSDFDLAYDPIDVVETTNGFIILTGTEISSSDFDGIQLIKVDQEGNFLRESEITDYVAPAGDIYLNSADSNVYFFAMNPTTFASTLIGINTNLEVQSEVTLSSLNYPLSVSPLVDGTLLLLSYDNLNAETEISNIGIDGSFLGGNSYSIGPGEDLEAEVIDHFLESSDRPLPFFCGEYSSGNYYFNGFYNYSFSTVFTDFGNTPTGVLQGQDANAGLRSALSLGNGNFAVSGYQFDDNYQLASVDLNTSGTTSSVDLYPGNMAEIKPYTTAKIVSYTSSSETYTVFASETKGNQIVLHFYNSTSGAIDGVQFVGFLNPFAFSSIKVTSDNSLLILGTTFVAGRFERIMLNTISQSEIDDIVN